MYIETLLVGWSWNSKEGSLVYSFMSSPPPPWSIYNITLVLCDFRIEASTPLRSLLELNSYCLPSPLPLPSTLEEGGQKVQVLPKFVFIEQLGTKSDVAFLYYGRLTSKVIYGLLGYFFFFLLFCFLIFFCIFFLSARCIKNVNGSALWNITGTGTTDYW